MTENAEGSDICSLCYSDTLFALDQISTHPTHALALVTAPAAAIESSTPSAGDSSTDLTSNPSSPVLDLFRRNALANGSIALAFVVTLSVFPAVTAAVTPVGLGAWWREPAIWVPLGFLCFNGAPNCLCLNPACPSRA